MARFVNPALNAWLSQPGETLQFAEVWIGRSGGNFELRHVADAARASAELEALDLDALRALAQTTATGAFRPNKAAPTLRRGWQTTIHGLAGLEAALEALYPGAVADWYAVQQGAPAITSYREYTSRQTGMYRVTQLLTDPQAAAAIAAGCHPRFCLRQRLWTVDGLAPDEPGTKSAIPCLDPCALMLEFARRVARLEQEEKVAVELSPSELETLGSALKIALDDPDPAVREGDTAAPVNPRRLELLRARLVALAPVGNSRKEV